MAVRGRWDHLQFLLARGSPLAHPDFEPSEEVSPHSWFVVKYTSMLLLMYT